MVVLSVDHLMQGQQVQVLGTKVRRHLPSGVIPGAIIPRSAMATSPYLIHAGARRELEAQTGPAGAAPAGADDPPADPGAAPPPEGEPHQGAPGGFYSKFCFHSHSFSLVWQILSGKLCCLCHCSCFIFQGILFVVCICN